MTREGSLYMRTPLLALLLLPALPVGAAKKVDFNSEIRPILSDRCYACHGPDEAKRLSPLRLDVEDDAKKDLGGHFAITPGDASGSSLVRRIQASDATKMPPEHSGKSLSPSEVELITSWIEQGAEWRGHWAFDPPRRPETPANVHPIDHFVRERLAQEGLQASKRAPKETLIRRASFDITGLPPTIEEVDAFLADDSPDAYPRLLDRLLDSPRYGERMAIRWLDAARYADTNGYQTDAARYMWRWRDWVIESFNENKPFDQFTIEQLAGDLLPNATTDQIVATGFNRNHRANSEGGIVAEEYLVEYAVDRVATTSTVWMGLTLGCARCHDHKYDPFTQKEFYQLVSYFNNIPERGKVFKYGNAPPFIAAPTPKQQVKLAAYDTEAQAAHERFDAVSKRFGRARAQWQPWDDQWFPSRRLVSRTGFDHEPTTGPLGGAAKFDGKRKVVLGDKPDFGYESQYTIAAWVKADDPNGAVVAKVSSDPTDRGYGFSGWGLYLVDGKIKSYSLQRFLDDGIRVSSKDDLPLGEWHHVAVTVDGSRLAAGMRIFVDGQEWETVADLDSANQEIRQKKPTLIGYGGAFEHGFIGMIDEVRMYDRALSEGLIAVLANPDSLADIAALPAAKRSQAQSDKLRLAFSEQYGPKPLRDSWAELLDAQFDRGEFEASLPTVMVMQELPTVRDTFLLARGAYDAPADKVTRAVPAKLPPMPSGVGNDRLGLAKWLVSEDHPLTARVMVNRLWQMYFGRGIVTTVEDFGSQGEPPTHPQMLDWLAREFIESGWDLKHLAKTIMMSETYQQLSRATPEALERDPKNTLLARGPRVRLPAEMVRDQALSLAGLLVEKQGGPSVKPYQPDGLWKELGTSSGYQRGEGDELYRRSLYTYWKRTSPPPFMMNFDSAGREACTVTDNRTNTPLQALNLMNDVTYVEAARVFAERVISDGGATPAERVAYAFRGATSRKPTANEASLLIDSFDHYLERYQKSPRDARELLSEGDYERDESFDEPELAAYTAVASLIMNLDEAITKE